MYNIKNIYNKLLINFNKYKLHVFIYKLFLYPFMAIFNNEKRKLYNKMLIHKTAKDRFTFIYKNHIWGKSKSGPGSEIEYTKNLRIQLPKLIKTFNIQSIIDAPCGDFVWMQQLLPNLTIDSYIGADIVDDLINKNNKYFANDGIFFMNLDITQDKLPRADLMIVRDCLFHFSYIDINLFLKNFNNSNIKYLLTTTHPNPNKISGRFTNRDIITADWRMIDLFSKPFYFNKKLVKYTIDDYMIPESEKQMILLEKSSVPNCLIL